MTRALVTGATGFIGPHLVDALLASGTEVACLVRSTARTEAIAARGVELRLGNLDDAASLARAVAGVDEVYHLAGLTKAFRSSQLHRVNAEGARRLAEACAARQSPPVLVLVSSLAAAGPSHEGHVRSEADPPAPASHYGRSKRAAELAAVALAERLPLTIVRPPIVFGPGDPNAFLMFQPIAQFGVHTVNGFRPQRFSLIDARDLAAALIQAARRGQRIPPEGPEAAGGRGSYFVADPQQPTYAELGRMIARAAGVRRVRVIHVPSAVTWLIGLGGELIGRLRGHPLIMNLDKAREATAGHWVCDASAARRELGFAPAAPLDTRLQETAEWYRAAGWLA